MKTINANEVILENNIQLININNTSRNTTHKVIKAIQKILKWVSGLFRHKDDFPYPRKPYMGTKNPMTFYIEEGKIIYYG